MILGASLLIAPLDAAVLRACVSKGNGTLRVLEPIESCRVGERAVSLLEDGLGTIFSRHRMFAPRHSPSPFTSYTPIIEDMNGTFFADSFDGRKGTLMPNTSCQAGNLIATLNTPANDSQAEGLARTLEVAVVAVVNNVQSVVLSCTIAPGQQQCRSIGSGEIPAGSRMLYRFTLPPPSTPPTGDTWVFLDAAFTCR
jgi:hypothetical protein